MKQPARCARGHPCQSVEGHGPQWKQWPLRVAREQEPRPSLLLRSWCVFYRRASLMSAIVAHCVKVSPLRCAACLHSVSWACVARNDTSQSFRSNIRCPASNWTLFLEPGGLPSLRLRGSFTTATGCCIVASFIRPTLCHRTRNRATVLFIFSQRVVTQQVADDAWVQTPHSRAQFVGGKPALDRPLSQGFPRTVQHLCDLLQGVVTLFNLHAKRLARLARNVTMLLHNGPDSTTLRHGNKTFTAITQLLDELILADALSPIIGP